MSSWPAGKTRGGESGVKEQPRVEWGIPRRVYRVTEQGTGVGNTDETAAAVQAGAIPEGE